MNKYLIGQKYKIPLVTDEVPAGEAVSVNWDVQRLEPEDALDTTIFSGDYLVTNNPTGDIVLNPAASDVGIRSVWLIDWSIEDADGVSHEYSDLVLIEADQTLVKGINSYQSYPSAMINAEDLSGIDSFKAASKSDQIAALKTAYEMIGTMTFTDSHGEHYEINTYDAAKLDTLDKPFLKALSYAQIIEANEMLDTNSIFWKRQAGIMSETIGESSMMFRPGNILNLAVTRRSTMFLRNYLLFKVRTYRAS